MSDLHVKTMAEFMQEGKEPEILFLGRQWEALMIEQRKLQELLLRL